MTTMFTGPLAMLQSFGAFALDHLVWPLLLWTALTPMVRWLLHSALYRDPAVRYYGHVGWLLVLPFGIALSALLPTSAGTLSVLTLPTITVTPSLPAGPTPAEAPAIHGVVLAAGVLLAAVAVVALSNLAVLLLRWWTTHPRQRAETGLVTPPWLRRMHRDLTRALGVRRSVLVRTCADETVPLTYGLLRPVVLLPASLLGDRTAVRLALLHELVHVRRYDVVVHALESIVRAAFWWHPQVRALTADLPAYRELACDAAVLSSQRATPKPYATLLYRFAVQPGAYGIAGVPMAHTSTTLKDRILAMTAPTQPSKVRLFSIAFGTLLIGAATYLAACTDVVSTEPATEQAAVEPAPTPAPLADEVFAVVDEMPEIQGGLVALHREIQYPEAAKDSGIEGRVVVQFVVDKQGNVVEPSVVKGIGGGCDEEALRAVQAMTFTPGRHNGEPANVRLTLPISFQLD